MKENTRIAFIDGLRGYAALGIFLIHVGGLVFRPISPYFDKLVEIGKDGVIVFFFISAISICLKIDGAIKFDYKKYLMKRYTKLASLYYVIIGIAVILFWIVNKTWYTKNMGDLISHLTFTNLDFINPIAQTSILEVEWTMPIIFWFYLLIPLLYKLGKWNIVAMTICTIGSVVLYFHEDVIGKWYAFNPSLGERGSPLTYLFTYLFAVTIFWLYKEREIFKRINWKSLLYIVSFTGIISSILLHSHDFQLKLICLFFVAFLYIFFIKPNLISWKSTKLKNILFSIESISILGIFFYFMVNRYFDHVPVVTLYLGLFIYSNLLYTPDVIKILFENKIIRFLGSISYALYLVHFIISSYYDRWTSGIFQQVHIRFFLLLILSVSVSYVFTRYNTIWHNRFMKIGSSQNFEKM